MFGVLRDQRTLHVLFPVASLQWDRVAEMLNGLYNRENVQYKKEYWTWIYISIIDWIMKSGHIEVTRYIVYFHLNKEKSLVNHKNDMERWYL